METGRRVRVRGRLLAHMPKGGVAAEIGVWEGQFSRRILQETEPRELHLIDPWQYMPEFANNGFGREACARDTAQRMRVLHAALDRRCLSAQIDPMPANKLIAICDDEAELRATISEYLEKRGYRVVRAADGAELDALLGHGNIAAVILDINMPGEDGLSILKRIRSMPGLAVIMLTAAGELIDRIVGLELGADDYLVKPVAFRELEARLRAVLRRLTESAAISPADTAQSGGATPPLAFAGFLLDRDASRLLGPDGTEVALTPMEMRLLRVFAEHPGRALSRSQLLELAHDRGWEHFDRSIDNHVARLRRKIERHPSKPALIRSVRGVGYLFDPGGA